MDRLNLESKAEADRDAQGYTRCCGAKLDDFRAFARAMLIPPHNRNQRQNRGGIGVGDLFGDPRFGA